jgi:hypothetical protein
MYLPWVTKKHVHIEKLVTLLDRNRSGLEVGQLLYNLTMDDTFYLNWKDFCQHSPISKSWPKSLWDSFTYDKTLDLNTLHHWVKQDSPDEYQLDQYSVVEPLIESILKPFLSYQTHYLSEELISKTIHQLFLHEISYVPATNQFYLFRGHSWYKVDDIGLLKNHIFPYIIEMFDKYHDKYHALHRKRYYRALRAFRSNRFRRVVINRCQSLFNSTNYRFDLKLESNAHLVCFTNGVYDLRKRCFRNGRPGDYCYYTTKYQYKYQYFKDISQVDHNKISVITDILANIIPDAEERQYLLGYLKLSLEGYRHDNPVSSKFCQIWLGLSGDGRKFLAKLIRYTFGDYVSSGSRLVVLEDSDDPDTFNDDYLSYLVNHPRSIWLRSVGIQHTVLTDTPVIFVPFYTSGYVNSTYTTRFPTEFYQEFIWILLNRYDNSITDNLVLPRNFVRYIPTIPDKVDHDMIEAAETLLSLRD